MNTLENINKRASRISPFGMGMPQKTKSTTELLIIKKNKFKQYLFDNNHTIAVMEMLGCTNFQELSEYIRSNPPTFTGSTSERAFTVAKNPSLMTRLFSNESYKGDLIEIVAQAMYGEVTNANIRNAIKEIENLIGITASEYEDIIVEEIEYKLSGSSISVDDMVNPIIDRTEDYVKGVHQPWCDEGIYPSIQEIHEVGLHFDSGRVVFPIKNKFGNYVGLKGRLIKNKKNEAKYLFLNKCKMGYELYGHNIYIQSGMETDVLFIFEGEKSIMKMNGYGILNAFSIGGSEISEKQAHVLNTEFKDYKIIMLLDKDKNEESIKHCVRYLEHKEIYTYDDRQDMLGEKDSPIDRGINVLRQLLSNSYLVEK